MLVAVIGVYVTAGTFDFRTIVGAVSSGQLNLNPAVMHAMFLGFLFAFAVKAPLWPFHTWLPGVATEATPVTAVLMMAVVDKVGTFGMLRYCLQLFPDSAVLLGPAVITLAVIGIVYGRYWPSGRPTSCDSLPMPPSRTSASSSWASS